MAKGAKNPPIPDEEYVPPANLEETLERIARHLGELREYTPTLPARAAQTEELVLPLAFRGEDDLVLTRRDGQQGYREFEIHRVVESLAELETYSRAALDTTYNCSRKSQKAGDEKPMIEFVKLRDATYAAFGLLTQQAINARQQNSDMANAYKQLKSLVDLAVRELPHLLMKVRDAANGKDGASGSQDKVPPKDSSRVPKKLPTEKAEILELQRNLEIANKQLATLRNKIAANNEKGGGGVGGGMQYVKDQARIEELEHLLAKKQKGWLPGNLSEAAAQGASGPRGGVGGGVRGSFATGVASWNDCEQAFQELNDIKYNQLIPTVMDDTQASFRNRWQQLCDRIATWAHVGYTYGPGVSQLGADHFLACGDVNEDLLCIYAREISVRLTTFLVLFNSEHRHLVVQGLVHRILHEEVFEGVKKFLRFELSDPAVAWMDKKQSQTAWLGHPDLLLSAEGRKPSSWRDRKEAALMRKNLGDANTKTFDPLKFTELDLQSRERLQANSAAEREKKRALRYNLFDDMDSRFQQSFDMKAFHLNRARMTKTIFQLVDDPMRPEMLRWRTSVHRLIFDTVEPARIVDEKQIRRSALKYELWGIVKDAVNLAISMQCQRRCWYTRMRCPTDDHQFDDRAMVDVREEAWVGQDPAVHAILEQAREINQIPFEVFSIGKVLLAVTPALFVRGQDDDYSRKSEQLVAHAGVIPQIGTALEMQDWARKENMVGLRKRLDETRGLVQEANVRRQNMEREGKEKKEWNAYHDLRDDEEMAQPTDLIPEAMRGRFQTKEARIARKIKRNEEARRARAVARQKRKIMVAEQRGPGNSNEAPADSFGRRKQSPEG